MTQLGPDGTSPTDLWVHDAVLPDAVADAARPFAAYVPLVGPPSRWLAAASTDGAGPHGGTGELDPGTVDAVVARAAAAGVSVQAGPSVPVDDLAAMCRLSRRRGLAAGPLLRDEPALIPHHPAGSWFQASFVVRLLRTLTTRVPRLVLAVAGRSSSATAHRLAVDAAFWAGVRRGASRDVWRRLTSSYVAFICHRVVDERSPGEERMNITPGVFHRRLRLLRRLGWRPLDADELIAFHTGRRATVGARRFVLTLDDGFKDAVGESSRVGGVAPQLFVNTARVGGVADWWRETPLAGWDDLAAAVAAGCVVGSHAATHTPLVGLDAVDLDQQLAGSLAELRRRLPAAAPIVAYPNGGHDAAVRAAARAAGFALA
jgi:polysaccharide deacetylase